jgi:peptidoglycan/xylan/chitin deacetylase (PgdA/CDA1 family)
MKSLPILTYHNVGTAPAGARLQKLYVAADLFRRQCALLARLGYRAVTLSDGLEALRRGDPGRRVVLTFDDGYVDNLEIAAPILAEFGFRATCFAVAGCLGAWNRWDADELRVRKPLMNAAQLRAWLAAGHELGSHTLSHPRLDELDAAAARTEIIGSRAVLQQVTGAAIDHFCYPYGRYARQQLDLVREAGYGSAVTTRRGLAHTGDDTLQLSRISINGDKGLLRFALKVATPYASFTQQRRAA